MSDSLLLLLLGLGVVVAIARTIYDIGRRKGRDDLLNPPHLRPPTDDERKRMLMRLTPPRWRRVLGWATVAVPCLLFWVFLFGAVRYGGSGSAFFFAWLLFFVLLMTGVCLSNWFWKPFRKAQDEIREARICADTVDPRGSKGK